MHTDSYPTSTSAHLLLVDDDPLVVATLARGLRKSAYLVSTAESSDDARELLSSGLRPDLVLLDVRMPGEDGLGLAERLRELDHIPFMILSAYCDEQTVQRAANLGALGYLVKPVDTNKLQPAVEAALTRAREHAELRLSHRQLQVALESDREISIAVGITMVQYRLSRSAAFEMLRGAARSQRCKLALLAGDIIRNCDVVHQGAQKSLE